jgi:hypothetical protein
MLKKTLIIISSTMGDHLADKTAICRYRSIHSSAGDTQNLTDP